MRTIQFVLLCLISTTFGQSVTMSAFPRTLQLYPQAADGYADIPVSGTASGPCVVTLTINRTGTSFARFESTLPDSQGLGFSFTARIPGEMAEYTFILEAGSAVVVRADSVVAGDVYLINGQSNAANPDDSAIYTSEWLRSVDDGTMTFCIAQARATWYPGNICAWGSELGKLLIENGQVPFLILNGAVGGTRIEQHLKNSTNPTDANTIYGRLLEKSRRAGVLGKVKAMLWDQGEANTDTSYGHYKGYFDSLRKDWIADYGIEHTYLFQMRPCCDYGGAYGYRNELSEVQRQLAEQYPNVSVISTSGINEYAGNHYTFKGYKKMAAWLFPLIARDFYGSSDTLNIRSPNLLRAYYTDTLHTAVSLQFDQAVLWPADYEWGNYSLRDYIYFDGKNGLIAAGAEIPGENRILLTLKAPSSATTITYGPEFYYTDNGYYYVGPWFFNPRGIGALSFCNAPIEEAPLLVSTDASGPVEPFLLSTSPNPFNPSSRLMLTLPDQNRIQLDIYNADGALIKEIASGLFSAGRHAFAWNGLDKNNRSVSAGLYVYRLRVQGKTFAGKIVFAK